MAMGVTGLENVVTLGCLALAILFLSVDGILNRTTHWFIASDHMFDH